MAIALFAATATAQQTGDNLSFEQGGASTDANAGGGTITFQGQVTAATCNVVSGQNDQTVVLPSVQVTELSAVGEAVRPTPFTINLTGCDAGESDDTAVTAYFLNGTNVNADGRLANANGSAEDVSIQLANSDGTPINIGSGAGLTDDAPGNLPEANLSDGDTTLSYQASYVAEETPVTAGSVQTSVEYVLRYR